MAPRLCIAGTGRSGSGYIAAVLRSAGVACGAESWWNPQGRHDESVVADSSCCALPCGLHDYDGLIFYQLRHPLDVVTSMWRMNILEPHRSLFARLTPDADPCDSLGFAMHIWYSFIRLAENQATRIWRVEDVDAALVCEIADHLGMTVDSATAGAALDTVPRTFNQHYLDRGTPLQWDDLARHDAVLAAEIQTLAEVYGYR